MNRYSLKQVSAYAALPVDTYFGLSLHAAQGSFGPLLVIELPEGLKDVLHEPSGRVIGDRLGCRYQFDAHHLELHSIAHSIVHAAAESVPLIADEM